MSFKAKHTCKVPGLHSRIKQTHFGTLTLLLLSNRPPGHKGKLINVNILKVLRNHTFDHGRTAYDAHLCVNVHFFLIHSTLPCLCGVIVHAPQCLCLFSTQAKLHAFFFPFFFSFPAQWLCFNSPVVHSVPPQGTHYCLWSTILCFLSVYLVWLSTTFVEILTIYLTFLTVL